METPRLKGLGLNLLETPTLTPAQQQESSDVEPPKNATNVSTSDWTPPTSPMTARSTSGGRHLAQIESISSGNFQPSHHATGPRQEYVSTQLPSQPIVCPFEIETLRDFNGKEETFGTGAWSTVYKAAAKPSKSGNFLPTPPTSPLINAPSLVAIKCPAGKKAADIIRSEARTFSRLTQCKSHEFYIVPFYGVLPDSNSLVLAALPLSLDDYIIERASKANSTATTWTASSPASGSTRIWLDLAHKLTTALAWLHDSAQVIHGDIKPSNVLLAPIEEDQNSSDEFPPRLLFADFSSSQCVQSSTITPNTLSAVTLEYTAPELLSSKVLLNPLSTATKSSDVFSLAVTLLVAATGDTSVYGRNVPLHQKRAMATQGWDVLNFVRNSEVTLAIARLPRFGVVERVLERALLKDGFGRVSANDWLKIVKDILKEIDDGEEGPSKRA